MDTTPSEHAVRSIARAVAARGGRALLVGGCVRDQLLGLPRKDFDLEVYGVEGPELFALLGSEHEVIDVGRDFGVAKLKGLPIDVSLPRRESKVGRGHRGFDVDSDPNLELPVAAARRDLTVNAIYQDPLTEEILDPLGGAEDLRKRVLRHCSPRFSEDSLRVLRVMQFTARLEFDVHPDTVALCRGLDLSELPRERIGAEWRKLLLEGVRPSLGLEFLRESDALRFFPELEALIDTPQNPEWHPEGDVFVHTLHCLDHFASERVGAPGDWTVGLALLCHDLGKPATTSFEDGAWRSPGHSEAGEEPTRRFLDRVTGELELIEKVVGLVLTHLRPHDLFSGDASDAAVRRLATKVDIGSLVRVARHDYAGRPPRVFDGFPAGQWLLERATALEIADRAPQALVLGRHLIELGERPGPHFSEILGQCFEAQLDGEFEELDAGLRYLRSVLAARVAED